MEPDPHRNLHQQKQRWGRKEQMLQKEVSYFLFLQFFVFDFCVRVLLLDPAQKIYSWNIFFGGKKSLFYVFKSTKVYDVFSTKTFPCSMCKYSWSCKFLRLRVFYLNGVRIKNNNRNVTPRSNFIKKNVMKFVPSYVICVKFVLFLLLNIEYSI